MPTKHGPLMTFEAAFKQARDLLGPLGDVKFAKMNPAAHRYLVVQRFKAPGEKAWQLGVIGSGSGWAEALTDAKTRLEAFRAEQAKPAAEEKPVETKQENA